MSQEKAEGKSSESKRAVAMPAKRMPVALPTRRAAEQVKEVPRKVSPRTVRGKIALYQNTAAQFRSAAREMLQSGARDMQVGVRAMQLGIKEQMKKYKEGAAALQAGVATVLSGIADMQSSIVEQMKENQEYTRKFYG